MTKYSLRARMMILILAPTLMVGLLLSSFFVVHRYNELQRQVIDAGANIIEPLAISSEYSMTWHNRDAMRELVSLLRKPVADRYDAAPEVVSGGRTGGRVRGAEPGHGRGRRRRRDVSDDCARGLRRG